LGECAAARGGAHGMTPRKRSRYTSETVKSGRSAVMPCACGNHERRLRMVMMPM
jgi:hypothetical protein